MNVNLQRRRTVVELEGMSVRHTSDSVPEEHQAVMMGTSCEVEAPLNV